MGIPDALSPGHGRKSALEDGRNALHYKRRSALYRSTYTLCRSEKADDLLSIRLKKAALGGRLNGPARFRLGLKLSVPDFVRQRQAPEVVRAQGSVHSDSFAFKHEHYLPGVLRAMPCGAFKHFVH